MNSLVNRSRLVRANFWLMRSSFPARSSKARATAVMASTPPSRSYREPSTVPTSCALVTNDPTAFPASHILKPCNRRQVTLYLPLTDRTGRPERRLGYGSSEWAFEAENNHVNSEEICGLSEPG